ncbi:MAG: hypothetical protein WC384_07825 [Prolixibacteraceae bacterium]|jgi:hypothetical protein
MNWTYEMENGAKDKIPPEKGDGNITKGGLHVDMEQVRQIFNFIIFPLQFMH